MPYVNGVEILSDCLIEIRRFRGRSFIHCST